MTDDDVIIIDPTGFAEDVATRWTSTHTWSSEHDAPPESAVRSLVTMAFWASLATEEGRATRARLRVLPATWGLGHSTGDVEFTEPVRLSESRKLVDLAHAATSRAALAITWSEGSWICRGIQGRASRSNVELDPWWGGAEVIVVGNGALMVSLDSADGWLLYRGGRAREVPRLADQFGIGRWAAAVGLAAFPEASATEHGWSPREPAQKHATAAICATVGELVRRAHGGLVLLRVAEGVPGSAIASKTDVGTSLSLAEGLAEALGWQTTNESARRRFVQHLCEAWVERVADLASVDGGVLVGSDGGPLAYKVVVGPPDGGSASSVVCPGDVWDADQECLVGTRRWGTRRRAAAAFAAACAEDLAIAVSQDGMVRAFRGGLDEQLRGSSVAAREYPFVSHELVLSRD